MIFSYNTFEKRRRNYASSFFFIIYCRATSREELTNRGLLLICVETPFSGYPHSIPATPYRAITESGRAERWAARTIVKQFKIFLIIYVNIVDNRFTIWYNEYS